MFDVRKCCCTTHTHVRYLSSHRLLSQTLAHEHSTYNIYGEKHKKRDAPKTLVSLIWNITSSSGIELDPDWFDAISHNNALRDAIYPCTISFVRNINVTFGLEPMALDWNCQSLSNPWLYRIVGTTAFFARTWTIMVAKTCKNADYVVHDFDLKIKFPRNTNTSVIWWTQTLFIYAHSRRNKKHRPQQWAFALAISLSNIISTYIVQMIMLQQFTSIQQVRFLSDSWMWFWELLKELRPIMETKCRFTSKQITIWIWTKK